MKLNGGVMRSAALLSLILIAAIGIAHADYRCHVLQQDIDRLTVEFVIDEPTISPLSNGYSRIHIEETGSVSNPGDPELPLCSEYIILSPGETPSLDVEVIEADTIPGLPPIPTDVPGFENGEPDGVFPGESPIYNRGVIWPDIPADIRFAGDVRGIPLGLLTFCPVRFDFASGNYIINRRARVDIDLGGKVNTPPRRYLSRPFMEMVTRVTVNGNMMPASMPEDPGTYLIICPDNCWDAMSDFIEHKERRGHRVIMKRLSDFGTSVSRTDIKQYIDHQYETLNPAPTFVVIVGDDEMTDGTVVPDFGYGYYSSDHTYSTPDTMTDYFSDIFLCRWPVDNASECRVMAAKTIWFETTPTSGGSDWLHKATVISTYDHAITPVWNVLWVGEFLERCGFTQVDTFFENGSSVPPVADIAASFNDGRAFIDYRGWAGSDGWWEPPFNRYDVFALTNSEAYPVVTSIVCGTGDFGSAFTDPCFGEAWVRAGSITNPRGAVAFFSTTDHDTHTRYNNPINSGFYKGLLEHNLPLFSQDIWLAEAECFRMHPWEYDHIEQYFHSYEGFGDPGLMMFKAIPDQFDVTHTDVRNGAEVSVEVTDAGTPVADVRICLHRDDTDESVVAYTNSLGATDLFVPGSGDGRIIVTAVKQNYIPYIDSVDVVGGPLVRIVSTAVVDTFSGDGDGILEPLEDASLILTLDHTGSGRIPRMETYLWTDHPGITVSSGFDSVTSLWSGVDRDFVFRVQANQEAVGIGPAKMQLFCDTRSGEALLTFELPFEPGDFSLDSILIDDAVSGDGDGVLDPGETATARIQISNYCSIQRDLVLDIYSVSGWIGLDDADSVTVGPIPPSSSAWTADFTISASAEAFHGQAVELDILRRIDGKSIDMGMLKFIIGVPGDSDPTGPDDWGYFAYDNTDISSGYAPTTSFEDISTSGTLVHVGDDEIFEIPLPFDFVFYGKTFDTLTVCSNGWAAPGSQPHFMLTFYNYPVPSPNGPWGTLAPFWDDLEPISTVGGVYHEYIPAENKLIVQWQNMRQARVSGMDNTFQMVIYDPSVYNTRTGDSPIEFHYTGTVSDVDTLEEYSTVGIESPDHMWGLEYLFSTIYDPGAAPLQDGRSILFTTDCGAGLLYGNVQLESGGTSPSIMVVTDNSEMTRVDNHGNYRFRDIAAGVRTITCRADDYFPAETTITIESDTSYGVDFYLHKVPVPEPVSASKELPGTNITVDWPVAPASYLPLTGYKLHKYLAPEGEPEVINIADTHYNDTDVGEGRKYWYRVEANYSGELSALSHPDSGWVFLPTDIDDADKPEKFGMSLSPNPFNTVLTIEVETPEPSTIRAFDISGRRLASIEIEAGKTPVRWDCSDNFGRQLPSGVYLIRLDSKFGSITKKAVLIK